MVIDIVSTWYIDKPQLKFSPIKIPRPIEEAQRKENNMNIFKNNNKLRMNRN